MKIKRTIMLVFAMRAAMWGVGCGRADEGDVCDSGGPGCAPDCKAGLYCSVETSTCQTCDEVHCGSSSPSSYEPTPSPTATSTASTPPDPGPACAAVTTPSVLCNDDEETVYCFPGSPLQPVASCRPASTEYYYCCNAMNDAGEDASDADAAGDVDADN
jgi:hypothetical protein